MFGDSQNTNNLFIIQFNCYKQILWTNFIFFFKILKNLIIVKKKFLFAKSASY